MESRGKQLTVIPNTGTSVPHIIITHTKEDYASMLSSISCSDYCSNEGSNYIHVTPES